eukprot:6177447-Pleurochrysis_carterae.AAC.5
MDPSSCLRLLPLGGRLRQRVAGSVPFTLARLGLWRCCGRGIRNARRAERDLLARLARLPLLKLPSDLLQLIVVLVPADITFTAQG